MSNIFENKKIKNHLNRIEKKGIIGTVYPAKLRQYTLSDGSYYGEILYRAFFKNPTFDVELLNEYLSTLMPEKIVPAHIKVHPWIRGERYSFKSMKQGQELHLGYLSFQEGIGEIVKSGHAILKLYEKNKNPQILGYSLTPKEFTETGTYIRRISKVCLFPNEYLAQRNITKITNEILELMEYRLRQKNEEKGK